MQSYFAFITQSKILSKCEATGTDSVLLGDYAKCFDQHKKLMAFYGTSKIVNLVTNKLNGNPKPTQQAKGNMMKSSVWHVWTVFLGSCLCLESCRLLSLCCFCVCRLLDCFVFDS